MRKIWANIKEAALEPVKLKMKERQTQIMFRKELKVKCKENKKAYPTFSGLKSCKSATKLKG